jgi:hypothetical protein
MRLWRFDCEQPSLYGQRTPRSGAKARSACVFATGYDPLNRPAPARAIASVA